MPLVAGLSHPENEIAAICRQYQVRELAVFGSAARGELCPESDVDLLVDFMPGARISLLELSAMARALSEALNRRVDLAVKPALKPLVRDEVLAEAQTIYAA